MKAARQQFERGFMLWLNYLGGTIFAVADDGWWNHYVDEWDGLTENVDEAPPGLLTPKRGFGHIWKMVADIQEHLGWATEDEVPGEGHCHDDDGNWAVSFGDWVEMLEAELPMPEPEPNGELLPFLTDWVWLPKLNMPFNLAFVAFVNEKGRCQFGPYDMMIALPDADTEFVREELRKRCNLSSS